MLINGSSVNSASVNGQVITARDFAPIKENSIRTTYMVYLTGGVDNLPDLELPVSSIQIRMGIDPDRMYLSVVVHGIDVYADEIAARPNGSLDIYRVYHYIDGYTDTFNMGKAPLEEINYAEGGRAGVTGTLYAGTSLSLGAAQDITLTDATTKGTSASGAVRYAVTLDPRLRPKDNATVDGITFSVRSIIIFISVSQAFMQVSS